MSSIKSYTWAPLLIIALLISSLRFLLQHDIGLNFHDEGFLWYGSQRILFGEVPMRDYMSYDPGRYYWSALFMWLFESRSLMSVRVGLAVLEGVGLFLFLSVFASQLKKSFKTYCALLLVCSTVSLCVFETFKTFEFVATTVLLFSVYRLLEKQTLSRAFWSGLCIGLVAFFCRQHGVYGLGAVLLSLVYLHLVERKRLDFTFVLSGAIGVVVGYSPMLLMLIFVPGFFETFVDGMLFLAKVVSPLIADQASTIPWLWAIDCEGLPLTHCIYMYGQGLLYCGVAFGGLLLLPLCVVLSRRGINVSPALKAGVFVSIACAHYSVYGTTVGHFLINMAPILLVVLSLPLLIQRNVLPYLVVTLICLGTAFLTVRRQPYYVYEIFGLESAYVRVHGHQYKVQVSLRDFLSHLDLILEKYNAKEKSVLYTSYYPGLYAAQEKRCPIYANFTIWPRTEEQQKFEIEQLKIAQPAVVLIDTHLVDREAFTTNHPLTYEFIKETYTEILDHPLKQDHQLFILEN